MRPRDLAQGLLVSILARGKWLGSHNIPDGDHHSGPRWNTHLPEKKAAG